MRLVGKGMVRMKLFLSGFACLVAGLGFASNLIVNGDFSSGAKGWLYGGSFGGGGAGSRF